MNEETNCRGNNCCSNGNRVIGKKNVGIVAWLRAKQPKESMGDDLIIKEYDEQKVSQESIVQVHVFADVCVYKLNKRKATNLARIMAKLWKRKLMNTIVTHKKVSNPKPVPIT